jgi:hypothetical protein
MAKLALKIPKIPRVLPKKPIIKGVDNNTLAGGVVVTGLIGLYWAQTMGWIRLPFLGGVEPPSEVTEETPDIGGTPTGHQINFVVSPTDPIESSNILLSGTIIDSNGVPYNAPHLYYYIYQEQEGGLLKLVSSGDVASNTSSYRKVVSLAGLRPGDYKARVSEELLPSSGQIQAGGTDIAGQAPPYTDNTFSPTGFSPTGITLS